MARTPHEKAIVWVRGGATHGALDVLGGLAGHSLLHGMSGGELIGKAGAEMVQALGSYGIAGIDDLVTREMLAPKVARALLQKAPKIALTPKLMQGSVPMPALAAAALRDQR